RPFFTEGNEVFMPSGRQRESGFYKPLELFYSRRIGRKLSDDQEVPLQVGSKAFGRYDQWEYGGFFAASGEKQYAPHGVATTEPAAMFSSVRLKKQILDNSSIGVLYVGRNDVQNRNGVIDIDGAFRSSDYQLAYQIARSYKNDQSDYAGSLGLWMPKEKFIIGVRSRYIGDQFDIQEVGYVPWQGTWNLATLSGPRWFFPSGSVSEASLYGGIMLNHEKIDDYTDRLAALGYNIQFRKGWGFEIEWYSGKTRDVGITYHSQELSLYSWYRLSPTWHGEWYAGYSHTYNFARSYLANYGYWGAEAEWQASRVLNLGASTTVIVEGNPKGRVEEITLNARPYFSWTPVNGLNARLYVDHLLLRSSGRIERLIGGFLLSYNLRSKSWFYFALNELQDRSREIDASGRQLPARLHMIDRVNVIKLKYLFYF
ncbi:MAG TPA: hydrolase, partial [bacterium]|nr:hydrolase [bacterium]